MCEGTKCRRRCRVPSYLPRVSRWDGWTPREPRPWKTTSFIAHPSLPISHCPSFLLIIFLRPPITHQAKKQKSLSPEGAATSYEGGYYADVWNALGTLVTGHLVGFHRFHRHGCHFAATPKHIPQQRWMHSAAQFEHLAEHSAKCSSWCQTRCSSQRNIINK